MEAPFNKLTPAQAERLALLSEELGEAQQAIGKILRHGYESRNPVAHGPTNRDALAKELGDVLCAIDIICLTGADLDFVDLNIARHEKRGRVGKYLHHIELPIR